MDRRPPLIPGSDVTVLDAEAIRPLVSLRDAIMNQRDALASLGRPETRVAPRVLLPTGRSATTFSYLAQHRGGAVVAKIGSMVPENRERGLPTVPATVLALDGETGVLRALLDGEAITTLRTVAASMAVAEELAPAARRITVFGAGAQGRGHLDAALQCFPRAEVTLYSRYSFDGESAPIDDRVRVVSSVAAAIQGADLLFTCTSSRAPIFAGDHVDPGATVIGVGSFAPDRREVDDRLVGRADVFVDDVGTALAQAGPIVSAIETGLLRPTDLRPIGSRFRGQRHPRRPGSDVTFYNSVGNGVQDAAIVDLILKRAERQRDGGTV